MVMLTEHSFVAFTNVLLTSIWLEVAVVFGLVAILLIVFAVRMSRIKHLKCELQRQLCEKTELLAYAEIRERKALEKIEEVTRTKKALLSRVNYEIRTPL